QTILMYVYCTNGWGSMIIISLNVFFAICLHVLPIISIHSNQLSVSILTLYGTSLIFQSIYYHQLLNNKNTNDVDSAKNFINFWTVVQYIYIVVNALIYIATLICSIVSIANNGV